MSEKRKRHLRVIDGGKSTTRQARVALQEPHQADDPKLVRLDQWRERMALLFARQRV